MTAQEILVLNLQEVRRRSIHIWRGIPDPQLAWKPDENALSIGETIRHVWEGSENYRRIVAHGGSLGLPETYADGPISSVETEIAFAAPLFEKLLEDIRGFTADDLSTKWIDRSDVGYRRTLGDFLARIAYHESVHAGQLLGYMRTAGIERPNIWD
jgi:uncharacterized damage-inducible protein DinB